MSETPIDVADLQRRLEEAEETLRAIREGEVDALLVRGPTADEVFHLGGGDEAYRAFMEAMDIGAAALDDRKKTLYANAALAGLLGVKEGEDGVASLLEGENGVILEGLLERARSGRESAELKILARGQRRHLVVTAAPLPLGFAVGWALTFTDISEQVAAAAASESERVGRAVLASTNEAMLVFDVDGVVTHANPAVVSMLQASPVGRRFEEAVSLSFMPGSGPLGAEDLVEVALSGASLRGVEASVTVHEKTRDVMISAAPLRYAGGVIGGCTITMVDLTERKVEEKRQALLMRELDHRMKNMLALVLSISTRTASNARDLVDFKEKFGQRIAALAATQDLLSERAWEGLTISDLLSAELAPFVAPNSARLQRKGLEVQVSRDAAVALGLVFHELVTNAVKYGALSSEVGQLVVAARTVDEGHLEVLWSEKGGPPVSPPGREGFGQTLIKRGLGASAARPTEVTFAADGVTCRITLSKDVIG